MPLQCLPVSNMIQNPSSWAVTLTTQFATEVVMRSRGAAILGRPAISSVREAGIMRPALGWKETNLDRCRILLVSTLHPHQVVKVHRELSKTVLIIKSSLRDMCNDTLRGVAVWLANLSARSQHPALLAPSQNTTD